MLNDAGIALVHWLCGAQKLYLTIWQGAATPDVTRQQNLGDNSRVYHTSPLLKSTDSPCVLIGRVVCNVCAFHFNLHCHFSPWADFEEREISILILSTAHGHLYYFPSYSYCPCASLLPSHILVIQRGRCGGTTFFLILPLKCFTFGECGATIVKRAHWACAGPTWMWMSMIVCTSGVNQLWVLTSQPHTPSPPPPPSPLSPFPYIAGGTTGSGGRERALIPKPVGSVNIQTRAFCLCCCKAQVRLACREYKSDLWQEQLTCR